MADHASWGQPVGVRIGHGSIEYVHGAKEGLDYLNGRWPLMEGPHMVNAKAKCRNAVEQHGSSGLAREAFIAAAIEADVLQ